MVVVFADLIAVAIAHGEVVIKAGKLLENINGKGKRSPSDARLAQLGRATGLHPVCHRFDSCIGYQIILSCQTGFMPPWLNWIEHQTSDLVVAGSNPAGGTIAEEALLAKQLICNQKIAGSIPAFGSMIFGV